MLLGPIFERFVQHSPISVMARGLLEHALIPAELDALFEHTAERQYTKELLFSTTVELLTLVVTRMRPSVHAAYQAQRADIPVSITSLYNQLDGTEPVRRACFVTRQHKGMPWEAVAALKPAGRVEGAEVFRQRVRLVSADGTTLFAWRLRLVLDQPTRDGERELFLLTNLPVKDADALR